MDVLKTHIKAKDLYIPPLVVISAYCINKALLTLRAICSYYFIILKTGNKRKKSSSCGAFCNSLEVNPLKNQ